MTHASHVMHQHSLQAYEQEEVKLSRRASEILSWIARNGPKTDREVMQGMGFNEPNSVRPRISELIGAGKLMEVCNRKDATTGKTVRVVDVRGQRRMFA